MGFYSRCRTDELGVGGDCPERIIPSHLRSTKLNVALVRMSGPKKKPVFNPSVSGAFALNFRRLVEFAQILLRISLHVSDE